MVLSSAPVPVPTTVGEDQLLGYIREHRGDTSNPHATKLGQLTDLTDGVAGQVVTRQADGTFKVADAPGAAGGAPVGSATPQAPSGSGTAGTATSSAREDHRHPASLWTPGDYGWKGWSDSPDKFTAAATLAAGTIYVIRCKLDQATAISTVVLRLTTAGSGLSNCYVGVYDVASLAQLGVSADVSTSLGSPGVKNLALTAPTAAQPAGGHVYVAVLMGSGTALAWQVGVSTAAVNTNITRYGTAGTGQTSLPATLPTPTAAGLPLLSAVA